MVIGWLVVVRRLWIDVIEEIEFTERSLKLCAGFCGFPFLALVGGRTARTTERVAATTMMM